MSNLRIKKEKIAGTDMYVAYDKRHGREHGFIGDIYPANKKNKAKLKKYASNRGYLQ